MDRRRHVLDEIAHAQEIQLRDDVSPASNDVTSLAMVWRSEMAAP